MTKVKTQNWAQLDFLINNFYEIVEFKRGRGIYGDRVILKRPVKAEAIFNEPIRENNFYYMDANPVKELPMTLKLKVQNIIKFVVSPEFMNIICEFDAETDPVEWALETQRAFSPVKIGDPDLFIKLNEILEERYKLLGGKFVAKLSKHKEKQYFLAREMGLVEEDYATEQTSL